MLALEEEVELVLPAAVHWNELHKVHHHCCIALIEHHEQKIKDLALALFPLGTSASEKRVLSNKSRRGSPRPSAVSSACPFSPRLCDEGTVVCAQACIIVEGSRT
jgi:hypothetical protein